MRKVNIYVRHSTETDAGVLGAAEDYFCEGEHIGGATRGICQ